MAADEKLKKEKKKQYQDEQPISDVR